MGDLATMHRRSRVRALGLALVVVLGVTAAMPVGRAEAQVTPPALAPGAAPLRLSLREAMALGLLVGSEANAPLARAVIGGLIVSTGFTLLLIPTLYTILEERFPRLIHTERPQAP